MRQVPLERDINIAVNGCSGFATSNQKGPFMAMLISGSRGYCLIHPITIDVKLQKRCRNSRESLTALIHLSISFLAVVVDVCVVAVLPALAAEGEAQRRVQQRLGVRREEVGLESYR